MVATNILITGGAGFIGSHLAKKLVQLEHNVTVIDNLQTGSRKNLTSNKLELIVSDIRNERFLKKIFAKNTYDAVYHLCAQVSVDRSIGDRKSTIDVNINGTANLLEAIIHHYSASTYRPFLIHVSSCEVYGQMLKDPMDESHFLNPCTPYAATKLSAEKLVFAYHYTYAIPVLVVRPFNCYGPRQRGGKYGAVIPNLISRIARGLSPIIHGDGDQTRDFTYITDIVDVLTGLINPKDLAGETINLGSGKETSINQIARIILQLMGQEDIAPQCVRSPRPCDIRRQRADVSKAKRLLGWTPRVELEQGLKETIDFFSAIKA